MVQLRVLNGSRAGSALVAQRFPCTIGRAEANDLRIVEPGVWENHLQIDLTVPEGFRLRRLGQGRASVNGAEFDDYLLRNGDIFELGAVKVQFWLAEVRQINNRTRELLVWAGLVALILAELFLMGLMF